MFFFLVPAYPHIQKENLTGVLPPWIPVWIDQS